MYAAQDEFPVFFHIVGKGDALASLRLDCIAARLDKQVIFHGPKYGTELQGFFERCHIGISSLGMHRIGVASGETSNLKVREYCARGIPFINGYLDRDLPADFPYVLNVAADESPVNITEALRFYRDLLKNHPDYPEKLHEFAVKNLSWEAKFEGLKKWILS